MKLTIQIKYHWYMHKIKSFIFGKYSTNAHPHLGKAVALSIIKGMNDYDKKIRRHS
ncbi:Uncharacterised protein [Niallia circulans]|uniref:hypothetical protein n=1 Tax=Niallia circulans TaxID=1397 RepID=UPI000ADBCD88|nr:Uncharacterised protein [Niallia circulans]